MTLARLFGANKEYPRGSWILPPQPGLKDALTAASAELGVDFNSVPSEPQVPSHEAALPRIAVWVPWADTDMIGWIRYTLDQENIPYTYLRDEEIRAIKLEKSTPDDDEQNRSTKVPWCQGGAIEP